MKAFGVLLAVLTASSAHERRGPLPEVLRKDPRFQNVVSEKIYGGQEVSPPYSIPHQVSIVTFGSHTCGGSVISDRFILTAAHCCEFADADSFSVIAGEHSREEEEGFEQRRLVTSVIPHEDYDSSTISNDICLLKLETKLNFNNQVKPVPLPTQGQQFAAGSKATVSGWGTTFPGSSLSDKLMFVTVPIVSDDDCTEAYGAAMIAETMICAGEMGRDSCQGDSGGPLTCDGLHCGLVSWGLGCGQVGYPGVYTETSNYINWIKQQATK